MNDSELSDLIIQGAGTIPVSPAPVDQIHLAAKRQHRRRSQTAAALIVALLLLGVTSLSAWRDWVTDDAPIAASATPVGPPVAFSIRTQCGIEYLEYDGRTWRTQPLGRGSVPEGLPPVVDGELQLMSDSTLVFTSKLIANPIVFRPGDVDPNYVCF